MKNSHIILIVILFIFILLGALFSYLDATSGFPESYFNGYGIIILTSCAIWCFVHAKENGREKQYWFPLLCFFFPLIGFPVYFFSAYGFKRGAILFGSSLLYLACAVGLVIAVETVVANIFITSR